eukprot:6216914-Ditylum_brightwellii.AAC.1
MDEFTATLDNWEQKNIDGVEALVSLNKLMAFMLPGQCLIVTDSLASDDMMPFVWKVVDIHGNVYFCHAGPAFGKKSLFRAEVCGILTVLCFLHQWMEHNRLENKKYMTVYLDNEGVTERIGK